MSRMERAIQEAGFRTLNLDYPSRHADLGSLAEGMRKPVEAFATGLGGSLHFVTHSMGGLVARVLLHGWRPLNLGRLVMLGPPNGGSELADRLGDRMFYRVLFGPAGQRLTTRAAAELNVRLGLPDYPVGIIADTEPLPTLSGRLFSGPSDGKVSVQGTKLDGMADHVTLRGIHSRLMRNPAAIAQTLAFLCHGRFIRPRSARAAGLPGALASRRTVANGNEHGPAA